MTRIDANKNSRLCRLQKGRRWARYRALIYPGVKFTVLLDGRSISYTLENGVLISEGLTQRQAYRPWELLTSSSTE